MQPHEVAAWWHAQPGVTRPRVAALDAHPHRLERTLAALLGVGAALVALGWALGRS